MGIVTICFVTSLSIGFIAVAMSIAMAAGGYDKLFNFILHKKIQITEDSEVYDIWRTTPVPIMFRAYFFNLTNPDAFSNEGALPIVNEVGPYIYKEYHEKKNITFYDNMTVSYFQERWWIWDSDNPSGKDPSDLITTVNILPVTAAFTVEDSVTLMAGLNRFFHQVDEALIVTKTVQEMLFDGFEDPLFDFIQTYIVNENGSLHWALDAFPIPPGITDYDKFGWFYKRNHSLTYDGLYNMYTGESSLSDVGRINWWNYANSTEYFSPPCNAVKGSSGELWPPGLGRSTVEFYSPDLCMTMKLYYEKDIYDSFGTKGYRFYGSNQTFTNQTYIPEYECYCTKGNCAPYGLLSAQTCKLGAPAFISFPHFYNADPELLQHVSGLHPNPQIHKFYININPDLGIPLEVAARFQINLKVKPYNGIVGSISILKKVPEVILPIFWFEILSAMTEELSQQMKPVIFFNNSFWPVVIFSLFSVLGIIFIAIVAKKFIKHRKKNKGKANFSTESPSFKNKLSSS